MIEKLESDVVLGSLPSGWSWARVADLGVLGEQTVLTGPFGSNLRSDDFVADEADAVPVLTIGCLQSRGIDREKAVFVGADKAAQMDRYRLRHGDVMFSRMATVGRAGLIEREYEGALFNYHLMRLRLEKFVIEPYYFIYFVRGAQVVADHVRSVNHGMTRDGINTEQLISLPIAVAPRQEQQRIVAAIESYVTRLDHALETLERVDRNLKRYRASVLKSAIEGRLVPTEASLAKQEGRDYEPASVLLERILSERRRRWSESGKKGKYQEPTPPDTTNLPELPRGWCWATVESLIWDADYGTSQKCTYEATGPAVLRIPNVQEQALRLDDLKFATDPDQLNADGAVKMGDLVFIRTNGSRNLIGRGAVVLDELPKPHHFASYLIRLRVLPVGGLPRWTGFAWHTPILREQILGDAASSAGQYNVSMKAAIDFVVPLPPVAEQARILEEVERIDSLAEATIVAASAAAERSARLRQAILKWAFEGKLADQDPNDEPASVLLERIKAERATATPTKTARAPRDAGKKKLRA